MSEKELAIHDYVERGDGEAVARLLMKDPNHIHARDQSGDQPLHIACWQKQVRLLGILRNYAPDLNARGCFGRTPLHYAVHEGGKISVPIVADLLDWGADPSLRDDHGFSVEDWAKIEMDEGLPEVLDLLKRATKSRS